MRLSTMLRAFLLTLPVLGFVPTPFVKSLSAQESRPSTSRAPTVSAVLGRPTDRSVAVNLTSNRRVRAQVEYGKSPTALDKKSAAVDLEPGSPAEVELLDLVSNAATHYRVRWTSAGNGESTASAVSEFMTQRAKGSTFTFGVQGDSHPERAGKMFNAGLYRETLGQVAAGNLDFYIALGDDFSTTAERRAVARHAQVVDVDAGVDLVIEGEAGDALFVVLEGDVAVQRDGVEIDRSGPGSYFGELAVLDGQPRSATVTALTDVKVAVIGIRMFRTMLREFPDLAEQMLIAMAGELREARLVRDGS